MNGTAAPAAKTIFLVDWNLTASYYGDMAMGLKTNRRLGGTREAAQIAGCSMGRIRQLIMEERIWSDLIGDKMRVVDLDEIEAWAAKNAARRSEGHCPGTAPGGFRPDNPGRTRYAPVSKNARRRKTA